MSADWADHHSAKATAYARYRPTYPAALFEWLTKKTPRRDVAWDCAAGSGQATAGLAGRWHLVVATDASPRQLARAPGDFARCVARAEAVPLREGCVDLIVVAQAAHWFAGPEFFDEVGRVARRPALFAFWNYPLLTVSPAVDAILQRFHRDELGAWWPPERALVDAGMRDVRPPFEEVPTPDFEMTANWSLDHLIGYIDTWSAVNRVRDELGMDPVPAVHRELAENWDEAFRPVRWRLDLRAFRIA